MKFQQIYHQIPRYPQVGHWPASHMDRPDEMRWSPDLGYHLVVTSCADETAPAKYGHIMATTIREGEVYDAPASHQLWQPLSMPDGTKHRLVLWFLTDEALAVWLETEHKPDPNKNEPDNRRGVGTS